MLGESLMCSERLGYGHCRGLGVCAMAENLRERDTVLLECSSSSLEQHAVARGR